MKYLFSILTVFLFSCDYNDISEENATHVKRIASLQDSLIKLNRELILLKLEHDTLKSEVSAFEKKNSYYNEDFLMFISKFAEDKEFQKSRILYPIPIHEEYGVEASDYELTKETWDTNQFKFYPPGYHLFQNEEMEYLPTNYRIMNWYGIESCGDLKFYFKGVEGKWFLYKVFHQG
ncbi:hypothetical protein KMW28_24065 [Flammeovirga yaeyamensis]|uniref:Lipoprotein n=1 Tax=Flammeovirga yaeyamensis TaxID=367791 RepID=A0AAX1ND16_9BACT|nr:hypothetical protein [Flammeovirga yaeyamensis]MBB3696543.1 hypothetical protein [Flammeovirga yaeyamensis]NMF33222.1 DUF4348 domain-containing protein [Flammeovirga yaeyamensis]QWG05499.1 hypothetical protein KMW28_24065 [Flammeovirga yaeyamensis]